MVNHRLEGGYAAAIMGRRRDFEQQAMRADIVGVEPQNVISWIGVKGEDATS